MSKNKLWKRIAAGALTLTVAAGAASSNISMIGLSGEQSIVASAADEQTVISFEKITSENDIENALNSFKSVSKDTAEAWISENREMLNGELKAAGSKNNIWVFYGSEESDNNSKFLFKTLDSNDEIADVTVTGSLTTLFNFLNGNLSWGNIIYFAAESVIPEPVYTAPKISFTPGVNSVNLEWEAVEGADLYAVCGYSGGKWNLIENVTNNSCVLKDLNAGRWYKVAVIARVGGFWHRDYSNEIVVTPKERTTKYPEITLIEHNEEFHQFRLYWTAVEGAEQYGVAIYQSGKWRMISQDIPAEIKRYTSPKLKAGDTYKVAVCAKVNGEWDVKYLNSRAIDVTVKPEKPNVVPCYESEDFQFSGNIYIIGDSTVCTYFSESAKNRGCYGWGMMLEDQFNDVTVQNLARAGKSSRSYVGCTQYNELCKSIKPGDYLFIQFGHNDEKTDDPERGTYPNLALSTLDNEGKNSEGQYSFEWILLNKYINGAKRQGATVVLVTPITRRDPHTGKPSYEAHMEYRNAMIKLGRKYNIPVIDMTAKTAALYYKIYNEKGADGTAALHCYRDEERTLIDNSHLNEEGCKLITRLIAEETKTLGLKIGEYLKTADDNTNIVIE